MKIKEGNIFEAMRLVLPEHRGVMADWKRQRSARKPPVLSEDEIQQIQNILWEAIANHTRVRLTLFVEYADTVVEGVPIFDGRLRIVADDGVQSVDVQKLIKVQYI